MFGKKIHSRLSYDHTFERSGFRAGLGAMDEDAIPEIDIENTTLPLTAVDREILSMKDEDYHRHTWDDLKEIIGRCSR